MGETSGISWTRSTMNFWLGCQRVSEACCSCYAETLVTDRMGYSGRPGKKPLLWGAGAGRQRTSEANWRKPFQWDREAAKSGEFWPVFASSLSDVFEDRRDLDPWRADAFKVIEQTQNLTWLLLTKRTDRVMDLVPTHWRTGFPPNVWQGTTVESNRWARVRVPFLQQIPAAVRFLSIEPQFEPMDYRLCAVPGVSWLIVGGESGSKPRPFDPAWARDFIAACRAAGASPFVKQMGEHWARQHRAQSRHGADPAEWEPDLRVQEFPNGRKVYVVKDLFS